MDNVYDGSKSADYNASAISDDSLFEWIFNVSGESNTTKTSQTDLSHYGQQGPTLTSCSPVANCAVNYLTSASELNAQQVTCAQINALGSSASGLYYVVEAVGDTNPDDDPLCGLPSQLGTPDAPAIVVVNNKAKMNSTLLYGLLFVRRQRHGRVDGRRPRSCVRFRRSPGRSQDHGRRLHDRLLEYEISRPGKDLPETTRFGQVPGSWLDNSRAGF